MRMMTGAILVLASVILFAVYKICDPKPMYEWCYAIGMGIIGWVFLLWGLVKDIMAAYFHWVHDRENIRRKRKGDS